MKRILKRAFACAVNTAAVLLLLFCAAIHADAADAGSICETIDLSEYILQVGGLRAYESGPQETEDGRYTVTAPHWNAAGDTTAETVILEGLKNRQERIDISAYEIPRSAIGTLYYRVVNQHPELFYVGGKFSCWTSNDLVTVIAAEYDPAYTQAEEERFRQKVAEIMSEVDDSWPTLGKILYLHDYLVVHNEYATGYNAYDALVEGHSVCQGYALAFRYLMSQIGVYCDFITSEALCHAWNLVELDGEYFYVDATWDDPSYGETYCAHSNFLTDRDRMVAKEHESTDWMSNDRGINVYYGLASSSRYNEFFWKNSKTAIPLIGTKAGLWKYQGVRVYDYVTGETTDYSRVTETWPAWNGTDPSWGDHSSVSAYQGSFYYTTPKDLYRIEPDGSSTKVYTLTAEEASKGFLYGLNGGRQGLAYLLQTDPYSDVTGRGIYRKKTQTADFVTRMYRQCLSREPDAAGLAGWAEQLESGRMNGAQVAEAFVFSDEMLSKNLSDEAFIKVLYRAMMGREADAAGLAGWLKELTNDYSTRSEVTKAFVESSEFTGICSSYGILRGDFAASGDIERFVSRFYTICLGRPADQKGLWGWVGQLKNRQMNGAQIAEAFFFSAEFTDKNVSDEAYVALLYRTILGREADADGRSGWVEQLMSSRMTRRDMLGAFIVSDEFTRLCAGYGIERGSL